MVNRVGVTEFIIGLTWVGLMLFAATHSLVGVDFYEREVGSLVMWLMLFLPGSLVGVYFNLRHRSDPFSFTGRAFNYLMAVGSFALLLITLPALYEVSPVTFMTLLLAAIVSLVSLRVSDESHIENVLPLLVLPPIAARYGFDVLVPDEQDAFWKWLELVFAGLAVYSIHFINRESERFVGFGPRAKWIWLHTLHSVFLALVLLALFRGAETRVAAELAGKASGSGKVISDGAAATAVAVAVAAAGYETQEMIQVDGETTESQRIFIWIWGGLAVAASLFFLWSAGMLGSLLAGEAIDPAKFMPIWMPLAVGLWALLAVDVSYEDRAIGATAAGMYGLPLLVISALTLLS